MDNSSLFLYNPWWSNPDSITGDRNVKEALSRKPSKTYIFEDKNLLIIGPRQVGKTTFLKLVILDLIKSRKVDPKQIFYFSCDSMLRNTRISELVSQFRNLPFVRKDARIYVFLDEISFLDSWNSEVKSLIDAGLFDDNRIYLTGSSSVSLKRETFPGRNIEIRKFLPLTFREYCRLFAQEELRSIIESIPHESGEILSNTRELSPYLLEFNALFDNYLQSGGFLASSYRYMNHEDLIPVYDLYWSVLLGDLARERRSPDTGKAVVQGVIKNYGSLYGYSSIAKEMDISSHVTVKEYLELFDELFLTFSVYQFDYPRTKVLFSHQRKTYFIDPFMFHTFMYKLYNLSINSEKYPALLEGAIGSNLKRSDENLLLLKEKREVDFYLPSKEMGIEVKASSADTRDFNSSSVKKRFILSRDTFKLDGPVKIIPSSIFLLMT